VTALLSPELPDPPDPFRRRITQAWLADESEHLERLLADARLEPETAEIVRARAEELVRLVRVAAADQGVIEAFMRQYDLSSEEGVLLMCVAEALLRIPDQATADALIRDKLGEADWRRHLGQSDSVFVNASTWGLMLTGQIVNLAEETRQNVTGALRRLTARTGEPVIRLAVRQAMRIMGHQFVMGRTIADALKRARKGSNAHYRYSFDMLGEAALTARDASRYLESYRKAIAAIGAAGPSPDVFAAPSISVKLSALHPRYEHGKRARVNAELIPRVLELAQQAKACGIGFTIDAEEANRLELSLDVILGVYGDASLDGWEGFGAAIQAYLKRAPAVIDLLAAEARPLRLLELGAGQGDFLETLKDLPRVTAQGIDLSESSVKKAQARGLDVRRESLERVIVDAAGTYDAVVLSHVLEHVATPGALMGAVRNLLAPKGRILFSVPYSPMSREYLHDDVMNLPPHHMTRWNIQALDGLARVLGLELETWMPKAKAPWKRALKHTCDKVRGEGRVRGLARLPVVLANWGEFRRILADHRGRERVGGQMAGDTILVSLRKA